MVIYLYLEKYLAKHFIFIVIFILVTNHILKSINDVLYFSLLKYEILTASENTEEHSLCFPGCSYFCFALHQIVQCCVSWELRAYEENFSKINVIEKRMPTHHSCTIMLQLNVKTVQIPSRHENISINDIFKLTNNISNSKGTTYWLTMC